MKRKKRDIEEENVVHIGEEIKKVLEKKGIKIVWVAEKLDYSPNSFYKILRKSSIDIELLCRISRTVNFDFYLHYIELMEKNEKNE
jgi:predicted transcriptional regulator